jgi:hypothetical protein
MWAAIVEWLRSWEGVRVEAERIVDLGDKVLVLARQSGQGKRSGVPMNVESSDIFTVRGGRIVRWELYVDRAEGHEPLASRGRTNVQRPPPVTHTVGNQQCVVASPSIGGCRVKVGALDLITTGLSSGPVQRLLTAVDHARRRSDVRRNEPLLQRNQTGPGWRFPSSSRAVASGVPVARLLKGPFQLIGAEPSLASLGAVAFSPEDPRSARIAGQPRPSRCMLSQRSRCPASIDLARLAPRHATPVARRDSDTRQPRPLTIVYGTRDTEHNDAVVIAELVRSP